MSGPLLALLFVLLTVLSSFVGYLLLKYWGMR